ncbi:MAG: type VI secretion system-associated FHA domain protein TagH [Burkholderiales bacterium]|nr:type VI secretion system-associated FHA domain protein TagH [Burkholderiales bacterium]
MLKIKVLSYKDTAVDPAISASFPPEGGTIGRSPGSTLLLPDPDRVISRTHAIIAFRDGRYWVRDQGTTVALFVNGRAAGRGQDHPLAAGDELRIAGYLLRVDGADTVASVHDVGDDETTTILRHGTMLSWSEDGRSAAGNRITTVIVPAPEHQAPAASAAAAVAAPIAATVTVDGARSAALPAPDTDVLLAALLRGAGLRDLAVPGGLTPQFMEEVGAVMRETLHGLLDLLAARAQAKREVRADATIIVAHDNNPLKFAPDLEAAVALLLKPPGQGFMTPLRSIEDARASLRSHQEGFVAGMRAALAAVLARFDPARLEQRLTASESGGSLLPTSHKAKLWNLYEELYGEISREAEGDFHFLFGEEFLRAYHAKARLPEPRARNNDVR